MTFLEKYELLKKSIPFPAVIYQTSIDCEYSDYVFNCKNCYFCFDCYDLQDGIYMRSGWGKNLVDCTYVTESEECYQCLDSNKCYSCTYLMDCNNCTNCHFSTFLNSCADCFGCVGLTHKKYCIFNHQYTKEEYFRKLKELKKENPGKLLEQLFELKQKIPHPASQQFNTVNCLYGDYIYNSKNCYWCFNSYYSENSSYNFNSGVVNNSLDMFFSGGNPYRKTICVLCYELVNTDDCYSCAFLINTNGCRNCFYSSDLLNCSDCFGCVGLKNKKYCILNNQLTKDQYVKAVKVIKKELGWKF